MTTRTTIAALISAAASLSAMASPARAQGPLDGWVGAVTKKVDASLRHAALAGHGSAVAIVRRTDDGRAELVRMECDKPGVARATRIAIRKLRKLPPLPAGFENQPIRIQMLLGNPNDPFGYHADLKRMKGEGDRQNRMVAARVAGVQFAKAEVR